ncbi:MAG TPA: peptidoglycan DD-metalloendopeptidase family protein, partial [Albitalea sp.]
ADGQRLLAYHGYLQRERARRIGQLAAELQSLAALEATIEAERVALEAARAAQRQRLEALERDRTARAGTLAQLESRYRNRAEREQSIGKDVKSLERLLATLREAAARAARERAAQERAARERAAAQAAAGGKPAPPPPAPAVAPTGPSVGGLGWPVAGTLLAGYGAPMPDGRRSDGVLIAADAGREVVASAAGRVVFADWMTGYGLIVIVDHGGDTMSLYAHNDTLLRDVGDTVAKGDPVARVGTSGGVGRPALYFELRRGGKPVDPRSWFGQQR